MQVKAQRMSVADYLDLEERSEVRHEYVDGEVYAMSGASRRHQLLVGTLYRHAFQKAAGRCEIFLSGMQARIEARNCFYYPDVFGTCDPEDGHDSYIASPCFNIEVLSPSTASTDRREKRSAYMSLKSVDEYIIVSQSRMRIDVYRRDDSPWASQVLQFPGDELEISCIGLRVSLLDIYHGVRLPPPEVRDSAFEDMDPGPDYVPTEWVRTALPAGGPQSPGG